MIATSAEVLARLQGANRETHWRLLIEDADGTMRDYSDQGGVDWRESAEWGKTVDSVMADGVVELASKVGDLSLAPMIEGSSLNRDAADAFAPAIDMGRALEVWVQATDPGAPAVEADWVLVYDAIIQKVDWAKTVKLSTLDRSALLNKIIRTDTTYGSSGGTAVETVMQQVIDDNLGAGVFTLAVPSSPGFMVTEYPHGDATLVGKTVRQALDDLSAAFAGYVDYRSDLTLIVPDRTEPTAGSAEATIGPEHYKAIPKLDVDLDAIRNVVRITFRDSATGEVEFVEVEHAGSIAAYEEQFIGIMEGDPSPIDTTSEATDMANDILSDLAVQRVQQQVQDWFFYPVELGDHITWKANGKHYDTDQHWAVTGFRHRLSKDKRETTFDVRGAASGGYRRWLRRADELNQDDVPDGATFKRTTTFEVTQISRGSQNLLEKTAGPEQSFSPPDFDWLTATSSNKTAIATLGLAVGDVVSASADLKTDGTAGVWNRLEIHFYDASETLIDSEFSDATASTTYSRKSVENITIPATAVYIRVRAKERDATGVGTLFARKAMLNNGPVALAFEEPPFRIQREKLEDHNTAVYKGDIPTKGHARTGAFDVDWDDWAADTDEMKGTLKVTRSAGGTVAVGDVGDRVGLAGQQWIVRAGEDLRLRSVDSSADPLDGATIEWDACDFSNGGRTISVLGGSSAGQPFGATRWLYYDAALGAAAITASKNSIIGHDRMFLGKITTHSSHGSGGSTGSSGENSIPGT